jgi:hypothetical protein
VPVDDVSTEGFTSDNYHGTGSDTAECQATETWRPPPLGLEHDRIGLESAFGMVSIRVCVCACVCVCVCVFVCVCGEAARRHECSRSTHDEGQIKHAIYKPHV